MKWKRNLPPLLYGLCLWLLLSMCVPGYAQIRIACVGDSLTAGAGVSDPSTQSYPAYLQQYLGSGYVVGNFGHSGASLINASDLPYTGTPEYTNSSNWSPNIVVIMLGTNDATFWSIAQLTYDHDYQALVSHYRNLSSHPTVYIGTCDTLYSGGANGTQERDLDFDVPYAVVQVSDETGAPLIDLHAATANHPEWTADNVHGNATGNQMLALAVQQAIAGGLTGNGRGLHADYFNSTDLTGTPVNSRSDLEINFPWTVGAPDPWTDGLISASHFSAQWSGTVLAPVTGSYTFSVQSAGGARVWVNGQEIINDWTDHASTTDSGTVSLTGGQSYSITLQYYNDAGGALAKLLWAYPGQSTPTVIPANQLFASKSTALRPASLSGTSGPGEAVLSWPASTSATSYNVYRTGVSDTQSASSLLSSGLTGSTYTDTAVIAGTTYYYKVAAVNANGVSALSYEASAMPQSSVPPAPANLTATPGNGQVGLSWSASSGTTSYNVYRGTNSGGEGTTPVVTGITGTSYTNTGLTNGTKYYFTVAAVNANGTSAQSNETSATPTATLTPVFQIACGNPGGTGPISPFVADTDFSGGNVANTQTHSIDTSKVTNPAPQAVYQGERWGAMTYTIPNLTAGASYTVRLHFYEEFSGANQRQFNVLINGTQVLTNFDIFAAAGGQYIANVQQFTTTSNASGQIVIQFTVGAVNNPKVDGIEVLSGSGGTAPSAPTNLTASAGNSQISLSWMGSSGATSYNVYRGTTAGGESTTAIATGITSTSYTNTGLTNGTKYYFKVAAVNAGGTSAQSNEASATPSSGSTPVIQIACGNPGGTGSINPFVADTDFSGGNVANTQTHAIDTSKVTNPAPQAVYQGERWGAMTYTIPGLTAGASYTVRLHFYEEFSAAGQRQFNVSINGSQVLTNFDIFAAAGGQYIANVQQFTTTANSSGQVVIQFTVGAANNPKIDGIEILH